jgi:hypothetical protein
VSRSFVDGTLESPDLPPMRLGVDPALRYLGATMLEIKGLALAERHHWVAARDGVVRRLLVAQFEGFLPSNDETYRYRLPDQVTMGGATWGSWVFCYAVDDDDPAPETVDTVRHLAEHGLELEREQIMARYARIVGDDGRNELLLFYHEPLRSLGHTLATASTDGELRPELAALGTDLQARARRSFEVLEA